MRLATSLIAGLIFGLGLIISGMVNPAKVQNFLDLFGSFDPSLAFVMAAAVAVTFLGYRIAFRRGRPLFADAFRLPTAKEIDRRVIIGPAIFGVGWGEWKHGAARVTQRARRPGARGSGLPDRRSR